MKRDFQFKKEWSIAILQFMAEEYGVDENYQGHNYRAFFQSKIDAINSCPESNKRGMTSAFNDINQSAKDAKNLKRLNDFLYDKFKHRLIDEEVLIERIVKKIKRAGKISNEEEYYLLREYLENAGDTIDAVTFSKLDSLLFNSK